MNIINELLSMVDSDYINYKPPQTKKKFRCRVCGKWFVASVNHKNQCDECIKEYEGVNNE